VAEPLLGTEAIAAAWLADASLYVGREWVAGPAGSAPLSLGGGVEIDVEVAWPSRLAGISIEGRAGGRLSERTLGVATLLLGEDRVAQLLGLASSDGIRVLTGRPSSDPRTRLHDDDGVSPTLFRPALARLIASDDPSAVRRAVALLESSVWLGRAGRGLGLRRSARGDARTGAELLLVAVEDLLLERGDAHELAGVVRRVASDHIDRSTTRRRLESIAADLDGGRHSPAKEAAAMEIADAVATPMLSRMMKPAGGAAPRAVIEVDRRFAPTSLDGVAVHAQRLSAAEVEVVAGGEAPGCFARAFDPQGTLLALAPLDRGSAVLLIPVDEVAGSTIDVTAAPNGLRPGVALLASERAIRDGRRAASAERAGRIGEASRDWRRSATSWREGDDDDRASIAEGYAAGATRRGRAARIPAPLIADRLIDS
jgi:hypothetical protein